MSTIDLKEDARLLPIRRNIADLSPVDMILIASVAGPVGDKIAETLDKYEKEIIRQQEVIARLQQKNRNYRTGMKQLQRAHESTLHQLAAVKDTSEQYRELLVQTVEGNGVCQIEHDGPYSPVRFNNDIVDLPVERQAELAKSI